MVVSLQALTSLLCLLRFIFSSSASLVLFFFFNDTATTEIYTLSLHDALPISFVQHAGEHVDALERATTASDAGAIARAAHAFKSAAGSIGAQGLAAALQVLEQSAHAGALERTREEWERARREADAVVAYLRTARAVKPGDG